MKTILQPGQFCAAWLMLSFVAQGQPALADKQPQWEFTTSDNAITIVRYNGPGGEVVVPGTLNGLPVTTIGAKAFFQSTNLTRVTIPASVKEIGEYAFGMCSNLKGVYFMSSAPVFKSSVFYNDFHCTVYRLRGTSGWTEKCSDRPTANWDVADQDDAAGGKPAGEKPQRSQ
ncbi:MAG: leucine-rich repeat domain-containing protein [Magnetococcus sp. WYHC-3]